MTYCVAMKLNCGLIFMADTRTNAGVDNVSTFRKLHCWNIPNQIYLTVLSSGNLATTQAVVSILNERIDASNKNEPSILEVKSLFEAAKLIARTLRSVIKNQRGEGPEAESSFNATLVLGGQIKGSEPRLFLIYPEGNFIEAEDETPFFQIGETKYGKPILVRAFDPNMTFAEAVKLLLISFDSTIKANISVGPPLDLRIHHKDNFDHMISHRFGIDDAYFTRISRAWSDSLKQAFDGIESFEF